MEQTNRLYHELADWWHLMSAPEEYVEEAGLYRDTILRQRPHTRTVLELGSGGGNNASHMKAAFRMTLCDLSEGMLRASRRINPELAHHQGDMRTVRLEQTFDAVFVHDAIMYMTSEEDLLQAFKSAAAHVRPGGMALFVPDSTLENVSWEPGCGGNDGPDGRGLRYLEWSWDPDPNDTWYFTEYSYLLREADGTVRNVHDRHRDGVFPRETWLRLIAEAGLAPATLPYDLSDWDAGTHEMFAGFK